MVYIHYHRYPPTLVSIGGKKYIVPTWEQVPLNTTLEEIVWESPKIEKSQKEKFEFSSKSDPNIKYITEKHTLPNGQIKYSCNCPGVWRAKDRKCKHIKSLL